jgi:hypothetical protein
MKQSRTFSITKTAEAIVPDSVSRSGYVVALGLTFVLILAMALLWSKLPTLVPLFFTEPWGEARLAEREFIILLPTLSLLVVIFNVVIGKITSSTSPLLPRMLSLVSAVVALSLLISYFGIVQSLTL